MIPHERIRTRISSAVLAFVLVASAAPAGAGNGPLYTPLAAFTDGKTGRHLWTVAGVTKRLGIVTAISCTSLDVPGASADIGVEFFDEAGTQLNTVGTPAAPGACNGSLLDVAAGSSVTIANGGTAQFHEDCIVGTGTFSGSARIVSTSSKVICNAQLEDSKSVILDASGNPTGRTPAMSKLALVRRNKQAGD